MSLALSVPVGYFVPDDTPKPYSQSQNQRLAKLIQEYPHLDERSKDIIDAIIKLNTDLQK